MTLYIWWTSKELYGRLGTGGGREGRFGAGRPGAGRLLGNKYFIGFSLDINIVSFSKENFKILTASVIQTNTIIATHKFLWQTWYSEWLTLAAQDSQQEPVEQVVQEEQKLVAKA